MAIKTRHEEIQAAKTITDKIKRVGEFIIGPKHKPAERMVIFDPVTNEQMRMKYWLQH